MRAWVAVILAAFPLAARAQYDCTGVSETMGTALSAYEVVNGLSEPVFAGAPAGDRERVFIVEREGRIKIHRHGTPPSAVSTFLDITARVSTIGGEMGLLGLAFDPDYAATGDFWVNYTQDGGGQIFTVVARYHAVSPDSADPAIESLVIRFAQPEFNHNGGMLAFGADGFLYVFTGDGGGAGDNHGACGNGQDRSVLLGKILRIDVRGLDPAATDPDCGPAGASYRVPAGNPFNDGAGVGFCDEIWSYGLRNPWRSSIDPLNGDLYTADVGQGCWEEVNWAPASSPGGENYGWRQMEGAACYDGLTCDPPGVSCGSSPPCQDPSLKLPAVAYPHLDGCAVSGGYVYRGCRMPAIRGRYFYSDLCSGFVRTFRMAGGIPTEAEDLTTAIHDGPFDTVASLGLDGFGEQYIVEFGGKVWKLAPAFPLLEVSARGSAEMLRLAKTGDWTWEDLFRASDVAVTLYRVYRGTVGGPYTCVFNTTTSAWPAGGDPADPAPGQLFAYVVTAVDATGQETLTGTVGTFDAAGCP